MPRAGGFFSPQTRSSPALLAATPSPTGSADDRSAAHLQHERGRRREIGLAHTQELQRQILAREAASRTQRDLSWAEERAALAPADQAAPWSASKPRRAREPAPWATEEDAPRRGKQRRGSAASSNDVLTGHGEAGGDEGGAVWDTAQGVWRRSPAAAAELAAPPPGWSAADRKRLKAEREAKAAEMEQKWDDGMSNISDALSDLLDTLSFDLLGTETSAVPEGVPPGTGRRQATSPSGAATHQDTRGLLHHRDDAPVERNISKYVKSMTGSVITRGAATFGGRRQPSGIIGQAVQPIKIAGPDNRQLPEGMSRGRRSGSAGLPLPTAARARPRSGGRPGPQPRARRGSTELRTVAEDDAGSDASAPTPPGSSDEEYEDPAAKASRLFEEEKLRQALAKEREATERARKAAEVRFLTEILDDFRRYCR